MHNATARQTFSPQVFQDHDIGPVMGVDSNTGAGGANMWTHHRQLLPYLEDDNVGVAPLPKGVTMSVSIRRSLRVGPRFGQPLEDLGVTPDVLYELTQRDLLSGNPDMINAAIDQIAKLPVRRLAARLVPAKRDSIAFVGVENLQRVDVYYDNRPVFTQDVRSGLNELHIPFSLDSVRKVELRGFCNVGRGKHRRAEYAAQLIKRVPQSASK